MKNANLEYKLNSAELQVIVSGDWSLRAISQKNSKHLSAVQSSLEQMLEEKDISKLSFFHDKEEQWDSFLMSFFIALATKARKKSIQIDFSALPMDMQKLLTVDLLPSKLQEAKKQSIWDKMADNVENLYQPCINALAFLGDVCVSLVNFMLGRSACSARDVWNEMYRCSVASLPIISLVSLLLGMILAFVAALQLRLLGADVYIASLVTISMVRVMGPVLTGIVVAGKTGASYAATLGTMKVNEEVDALETFGISPLEFLVVPRVFSMLLMTPILTMYSNLMGTLGGFIVGVGGLGIAPQAFIENIRGFDILLYLWQGLLHAVFFGGVIALMSTYQGMKCGGNAEAVGIATTRSVVNSIVGIIIVTAILTIILNASLL